MNSCLPPLWQMMKSQNLHVWVWWRMTFILILSNIAPTQGLNILLVSMRVGSHLLTFGHLGDVLITRGHQVTLVFPSSMKQPTHVFNKEMKIEPFQRPTIPFVATTESKEELVNIALTGSAWMHYSHTYKEVVDFNEDCEYMMEDKEFLHKMEEGHFDLAILDFFLCLPVLPYKLSIPFVVMGTTCWSPIYRLSEFPSYVPRNWHYYGFSDRMSFVERFINTLFMIFEEVAFVALDDGGALTKKYVAEKPALSVLELARRAELFFFVKPAITDFPRPTLPNVVRLNLMGREARPLSSSFLKKFMETAEHGVIVVSFGTVIAHLPKDVTTKFLTAFGQLKQRVVMKFTGQTPEGVAPNILLTDWLPQNDLVGHPNTQLFIGHGGTISMIEAAYHGIPTICVPFYIDQLNNCAFIASRGYGVTISLRSMTSDDLVDKIHRVLEDRSFKENAQRAAAVLHDEQNSLGPTVDYWMNYVLTHGTSHLRHHALDMPLSQYYMLDVFCILAMLAAALPILVLISLGICVKFCRRSFTKLKGD